MLGHVLGHRGAGPLEQPWAGPLAGAIAAILAVAWPGIARAGDSSQPMDEIIVSVQKREQSLKDVPLAVSTFSESFLEKANISDLEGLVDFTPGFAGKTADGFTDALSIRGISTNDYGVGGDPSIPVFVDGFWEGRNGGAVTSFLDVARTEVVRGPQNTLFGRNAIGGAISVTTNKPTDTFGGSLDAEVANYGHYEGRGTINVPLTDTLFFRGSAYYTTEDGYLSNLAGGQQLGEQKASAGQAALRYAGDLVDATLTAFYETRRRDPSEYWSTYPVGPDGRLDENGNRIPDDKVLSDSNANNLTADHPRILRTVLNADIQLPDDYTLTSITGYKGVDFHYREDYDATGVLVNDYEQDQRTSYWSQEFRINSPGDGRLVWFAGGSYYHESVNATFRNIYNENELCQALPKTETGPGAVDSPDDFTWAEGTSVTGCADPVFEFVWGSPIDPADIETNKAEENTDKGTYTGFAFFADGTYDFTDRLSLTLGARYTYDKKEFRVNVLDSGGALGNNLVWSYYTDGFVGTSANWSAFSPRAALNFKFNDEWTFYGNVGTGYKSGGFSTFGLDLPAPPDPDGLVPPGTKPIKFDPEEVLSVELGTRGRLLDDRLQFNFDLYNYQYKDLQLTYFVSGTQLTGNVARARGFGAELDARWVPNESFDFILAGSWSDTKIEHVDQSFLDAGGCDDCEGNSLWFSPRWTTSVLGTYHYPLADNAEAFFSTEYHYQAKMYAGPDNLALSTTPSWDEVNFSLGYDSGREWVVTGYVENAFNEQYFERGWENADADNFGGYGLVNTLVWPSKPRTVGLRASYKF